MTAKEYLGRHVQKVNGMLKVGRIDDDGHYCIQCFDEAGELTKVTHSSNPYGWVARRGISDKVRSSPLAA
jgi:hypothetical protein